MSKLSDQQLDDLIKGHLMNLEKDLPTNSWSTLSKSVVRNNFLKFSWKSFNIFHVVGIAVVSISAVIYVVTKFTTPDITPLEKNIPFVQDTITRPESPNISEPKETKIQNQNPVIPNKKIKTSPTIKLEPAQVTPSLIKDTIQQVLPDPVPEINNLESEKKELPKVKKVTTIIKRDTIRIKDTVNLKRFHW